MDEKAIEITLARTDADIAASFPIVRELRTHLTDAAAFRVHETLSRGRYMYVEDLVTSAKHRSYGLGDKLFDWLAAEARTRGCAQMEIISGVQRGDAHRFYHRKRMTTKAFQLVLPLG